MPDLDPHVSLVVVAYEMARELPRTLYSLSADYQRACQQDDVEVIVVDNNSRVAPRAEDFAHLAGRFRFVESVRRSPSPVFAINQGLALTRGDLIGVWIDGARLASPGLIAACRAAARLHPRAVIATLNYQLGPQLQYLAAERGYDRDVEDRLLASIAWPADGYRLFEIATAEARRGPAGTIVESNALFMSRALWHELSGFDEAFVEAGGGGVNADTLLRALALPGVQLIRVVGEGTFHQFHDGLTTSVPHKAIDTMRASLRAYAVRRGRPFTAVRERGWLYDARSATLSVT